MARMLELTKELELLEEAEPAEPEGPAGAVDEAAIEDYLARCRAGEIKTHTAGDPALDEAYVHIPAQIVHRFRGKSSTHSD
jgi:hypothetical protein